MEVNPGNAEPLQELAGVTSRQFPGCHGIIYWFYISEKEE